MTQPDNNPQGISDGKIAGGTLTNYNSNVQGDQTMYDVQVDPVEITGDKKFDLYRENGKWWQKWFDIFTYGPRWLASQAGFDMTGEEYVPGAFLSWLSPQAALGYWATSAENSKNRKWSEKQATTEYERQRELIREANDYNERWDQRLRSAGINPLAAFSKGTQGFQSSNAKAPSAGNPTVFNSIQSMMQMMSMMSDIKLRNVQANKIQAETVGQENENATYWERHRVTLDSMLQGLDSERARTRILNCQAEVAEATKQNDIESAAFNTRRLYNEMLASDLAPEQVAANLEATYAGIIGQYIQNQIGENQITIQGQTIALNNITMQQAKLVLNEFAATSDARVARDIAQFNSAARIATKEANWYTVDKFFEKGQQITGMLKDTGSFINSLKPGVNISTTQTHEGFDKNGNPTWSRTTTNTQKTPTR